MTSSRSRGPMWAWPWGGWAALSARYAATFNLFSKLFEKNIIQKCMYVGIHISIYVCIYRNMYVWAVRTRTVCIEAYSFSVED